MPPSSNGSLLCFGVFDLDPQTCVLRKNGRPLKVQPQPAKVLALLVARPNELITREELSENIWGNSGYGDFEHALNVCISQLRVALDDNAESPRWIETVPRRGYRFLAPVELGAPSSAAPGRANPSDQSSFEARRLQSAAPGPPVAEAIRKLPLWVAAACVLVVFCLAAGYRVGKGRIPVASQPTFTRLTYQRGIVYSARFAPDGHVVYGASWDNKPVQLFSTPADASGPLPLEFKDANLLAVSSQGELAVELKGTALAYPVFLNGTLARAPLTGGSPREMMEDVRYADWDARGELAVVHHAAGKSRLEYPIGKVLYETSGWVSHLRISPNGDKIAFLDHPVWAEDRGAVTVIDLSGNKRTLSTAWTTLQGLAWSPRGDEVWFTGSESNLQRELLAVDLLGRQRTILRMPGQLTLRDIAPNGRVLISLDKERDEVIALNLRDKSQKYLTWFDSTIVTAVSGDGKKVLLDEQGGPAGAAYYVGVRSVDGSPPVRLGDGWGGGFSPDEKWTATQTMEAPESTMLLPIGAGRLVEIKHKGILNAAAAVCFTPDGQHIVYDGTEPGHAVRTYIQDMNGGTPRAVTPEGARAPFPSPDGKYLAGFDPERNLTVYRIDGGQAHAVPGRAKGFRVARWSVNGKSLYVYRPGDAPARVYRVDWKTGNKELIQELMPSDPAGVFEVYRVAMTPDAKLFVYSFDRILSELYVVSGLR